MEKKGINSSYDAVEKLVKIIEAEKEETNEKNEYAVYLRRAEEAARKAEAAARKAEVASWRAVTNPSIKYLTKVRAGYA